MTVLRPNHDALKKKRTIFLKSVKTPLEVKRLLQPASTNSKLGGGRSKIEKGRWKGLKMYQLVLEERKTCPSTCQQWSNCYGNNMYLANRIDHKHPKFMVYLAEELAALEKRHPDGFVVRLHVLGDFYSKTYVKFWGKMMKKYPQLKIFGYTHRYPEHKDGIGKEVLKLNKAGAWIRFSDRGGEMSAQVGGEGIQCPQEVGKTASCLTCGLCWQTTKAIRFLPH